MKCDTTTNKYVSVSKQMIFYLYHIRNRFKARNILDTILFIDDGNNITAKICIDSLIKLIETETEQ